MRSNRFKSIVVNILGFLVLIGGAIGYAKAGSVLSVIMGSCFGLTLIACGLGIARNHILSYLIALLLTLTLAGFFGYRYYLTKALVPAGVFSVTSLLVFALLLVPRKES